MRADQFFNRTNLGITPYVGENFLSAFRYYFAEIFLLFFVMVHILKENLAGVFDVSYDAYETFEEGLLRYRLQTLCNTEEERREACEEFSQLEAVKKINSKQEIDPYRKSIDYYSDYDKFEYSERVGDPIRPHKEFPAGLTSKN